MLFPKYWVASNSMTRKNNKGQRQESIEEHKTEAWELVNWVQKEKKKSRSEWSILILA